MPSSQSESLFAKELHERIRREFPELRIYRFWDRPVGPHPTAMFEVNTFDPHQTGALFSWLAVNRGPCSVLIHPNTDDPYRDHTERAIWMGRPWPLNDTILKKI
ncbi:DOPA-like domain-containing protein [Gymnopilus junonius]|uniref:DOPA-like domain-containing protein n=1 Tax=Gymnopilus junonius TaxID=109634 RepID=A0A9P5NRS6_GYMJU|nr:DOPA-like domain-containing protein [Gymnopilus junonius]